MWLNKGKEKKATVSIVKLQVIKMCLHFGKLDLKMNFAWNCPEKFHCQSHYNYNLRRSALVLFGVTPIHLFSKYRLQAQIFKIPASAKLAVKYRPGR